MLLIQCITIYSQFQLSNHSTTITSLTTYLEKLHFTVLFVNLMPESILLC